jgi:hypothetical protein
MNHMMIVKKSKMKSITIHGIDEPLAKLIKSKAKQEGLSINQTIKNILESSLGVKPKDYLDNISRFEEFCGIWSKKELSKFEKETRMLRRVDPEDWL